VCTAPKLATPFYVLHLTRIYLMADRIPTLYDVNSTGMEIGRGAYGRVFEVNYQGTLCAAKEVHALLLHYSQGEEFCKIKTDFLNECQIWSTIRHPCVVQFLGMSCDHSSSIIYYLY